MVDKFDPYAVLGLGRGATPKEIKSAYRARAMQTHPDHGGSAKEFDKVNRANVVLLDPKKRSKFDRTGEIDEDSPDNAISAPLGIIIAFMQAAIIQEIEGQGGDPLACDLMKAMREQFRSVIAKLQSDKKKSEKLIAKLRKVAAKTKKKKGDNIISRSLETHASGLAQQAMQIDMQIKAHEDAIAMSTEYEFEADKQEMAYHGLYRAPFSPYNR